LRIYSTDTSAPEIYREFTKEKLKKKKKKEELATELVVAAG
jgi:hypothetical protein